MSLREQLALAAKACSFEVTFKEGSCKGGAFLGCFHDDRSWRPDTDDADGARLEAACRIGVDWQPNAVIAWHRQSGAVFTVAFNKHKSPQAARRYAVFRVAMLLGAEAE